MQASMFIFSYRLDFSCNVTDLICLDTEALLNEVGCSFCSRGLFKLSWLLSCQKIKEKNKEIIIKKFTFWEKKKKRLMKSPPNVK